MPIQGSVTGSVTIQWGDGTSSSVTTAANVPHTYADAGTFQITITGTFTHFGNGANGYRGSDLVRSVQTWGKNGNTSFNGAFAPSSRLTSVPNFLPSTTPITDLGFMFNAAP